MLEGRGALCNQDLKVISFLRLIWFMWHELSIEKKNSLNRSFALLGNNSHSGSCMYGMFTVPDRVPSTLCVSNSFNPHSSPVRGAVISTMKLSLGETQHAGSGLCFYKRRSQGLNQDLGILSICIEPQGLIAVTITTQSLCFGQQTTSIMSI